MVSLPCPCSHRRVQPWLYAALHRGHPGDLAFYLAECAGAATVLELGVGYGRLAVPLAAAGHVVTGVDIEPELLAAAAVRRDAASPEVRRRLSLLEGDMTALELGRRFDRVLIPYSGLHCLLDDVSLRRCLQRVVQHLRPDGRLIFDTYLADDLHHDPEAEEGETEPEAIVELELEGRRYVVEEQVRWQRRAQRLDTTYRAAADDGSEPIEQHIPQRYLLLDELERALAEAGMTVAEAYGDFDRRPLTPASELRVVVAELS